MTTKVSRGKLIEAGLAAMRRAGKPLTKAASRGSAQIYETPNGETVRLRTCNDHKLIINADLPDPDAKLDIEATDWLLQIMPEVERAEGNIVSYLIPSSEATSVTRQQHRQWLERRPATKGNNTTWTLFFKEMPGFENFAERWAKYRLK